MVAAKTKDNRAVEMFLSRGKTDGIDLADLSKACDKKIRNETQVSAKNAVALGKSFVKHAKPLGGDIYLTALRAYGWAALVAGKYADAENVYLQAREILTRDPLPRARIDRVLIDVYMYLDNFKEAERRAKMALSTFQRQKSAGDSAMTRVNYANLLHRQDRHREANSLYRKAATYFKAQKNDFATALCWYNQANTHVQLFDFKAADGLFNSARRIFARQGNELYATGCLYGLAWMHMLEGNFHTALRELTECEIFYESGQHHRELVLCRLDRAECYLGLNLFTDARSAADQALREARKLGITYESGKAAFMSGKASIGMAQTRSARVSLRKAEQDFKKVNNEGFLAATHLAMAQLDRAVTGDIDGLKVIRRRFSHAQLPLWEAICDLQILSDWPDEKATLKRLFGNRAARVVPHLAARKHTVLGDRAARNRKMRTAVTHWTKAAEILDAVRAKLPPIDMRSSFFKHRSEPHERLVAAEYENEPMTAAVWSERFKTVGIWSTSEDHFLANPARTRVQESLSALAGQVTAISGSIGHPVSKRTTASQLPDAYVRLYQEVRHDLSSLEKQSGVPDTSASIRNLIHKASSSQPVVQFHIGRKDIICFVHYRGESRAHRFADGVATLRDMVARWRFLVECAPANMKRLRKSDLRDEKQLMQRIGNWLLPMLELPSRARRILIIPEGQLSSLPWNALENGSAALGERHQLILAPSVRHHLCARRRKLSSQNVRIFVGDTKGLSHTNKEIKTVQSSFSNNNIELSEPCRRRDWPVNGKDNVWHFTGHALMRADNPFYSALMLEDGPLFAADFRLMQNRVNLVTLAACRTGQQTCLPGEEATGLVRSLLEMGARNVIASGWAVADHSTSLWMDLFYKNYLDGMSITGAIQRAALGVREKFPSVYHWGSFSVFGAG